MIKVGIIGATGYAGNELVRLLLGHKDAEIVWYGSRSYIDQKYADVYRNMFQLVDAVCMDDNMDELAKQVDVIFTATPQGLCASLVNEEILSNTKIVDLSADFRLKDVSIYEQWYKLEHKAPQYIDEAVYGLCEINRNQITEKTRIVANPGCYTTTSILTLYPMVKEGLIDPDTIIIDAKSGTSGAGRGAKVANLFCEVNESMKAYGVGTHRHTPEIEEQLGYACGRNDLKLIFTPHLVPMNRGILVTAYANLAKDVTYEEVKAVYDKYYKEETFVRVLERDVCPETRWVEGSNFVDIGFKIEPRTHRLIMMGALDNLVKGAAGQAVQNMNLLFGYACGRNDLKLIFTPHLVPMNRGILVTAYANLAKDVTYEEVKAVYDKYYKEETFVRVLERDVCPETRWVEGSNFVDIGFKIEPRTHRLIMMGALDNLVKGAAGQAVQNMNLLFGLPETEGLMAAPMFP